MMVRLITSILLLACALNFSACQPPNLFYWGSYEDSLLTRQQQAGLGGEAMAANALFHTLAEAQSSKLKMGPGIHADYGYLLFKQGRIDEAITELQQEAALYPESKTLMQTMISRIQERKDKVKGKTPSK